MKIFFINCQSFRTAQGLSDIIDKYDVDIMCLNETFENSKNVVSFKDWTTYSSPRPNQSRGGTAICVKPSTKYVTKKLANQELKSIEMTCINISFKDGKKMNIWCPYVPPEKPQLMEDLCQQITNKMPENTVVIGDLNAKNYQWNNKVENNHGKLLETCMTNNKLICCNDGQATRRNSESVIDLALTSESMYKDVISCETLSYENVKSDHIGILLEISSCVQEKTILKSDPSWNIHKCDFEQWKVTTNNQFRDIQFQENQDLNECYQIFEDTITNCMDMTIPKTSKREKGPKKPCWWNRKVQEKKHALNQAQRKYKLRSTPTNLELLKEAEEEFDKSKDEAIEEWSINICENINKAKNIKDKWSEFKKFTKSKQKNIVLPFVKPDQSVVFEESQKAKELEETFFKGKHLKTKDFDDQFYQEIMREYSEITLANETPGNEIYNEDISLDELEGAIFKLKKDTAPGPDSIFSTLIINAGHSLIETLLNIINKSWKEGNVPSKWKQANVKFLKKPGKTNYNTTGSYRPISLTSVLGKIMEKIVTSRLEAFVESENILDEEQEGFRHFRSTTNALINLTQSITDGFNEKEHTLAIFIDFEKAYDSVWREGLKLFGRKVRKMCCK